MPATKQKPNIPSRAFDTSGNSNDGIVYCVSDPFTNDSPFTHVATSALFANTADRINLLDFSACEGLSACTIMGWANKDNVANAGTLFRKISTSTSSLGAYIANVAGMKFVVEVRNGAASYALWDFAGVITNGAWFHWAMVFNGGGATNADKLKLYVNGTERTLSYTSTIGATTPSSTASAYIGWDASVLSLMGKMKDVRFYNTNLTEARIDAIYAETNAPYIDNTNLVGHWEMNDFVASRPAMILKTATTLATVPDTYIYQKFEEGTGTSCVDQSANVFTGTLAKTATGNLPAWVARSDGGGLYALDFTTGSKVQCGFVRPTSSFTVMCVVEFDSLGSGSNYPCIITDGDYISGTDQNGWYVFLDYAGGGFRFQVCNGGSTATSLVISHATLGITTGIKYHIACRFDDTNNTIKVYINGIEKGSAACTHSIAYGTNSEQYTVGFLSDPSVVNDNLYGLDGRVFWHTLIAVALDDQAIFDNYKKTLGVQQ